MLTGYQVETIAFITDGGIYCADCATRLYGEIAVAKAERGLDTPADISPLIRYEIDTLAGELASEHADEVAERETGGSEDYDDVWQDAYDEFPGVPCDHCTEVIE